ncbi:hypothetical protein Mal15_32910 [Stieleria maiorica]|uniref:Uncharacterized protein n=1 Tax=Stieleria maiorica TaxID=2795974 RepID=A0A5B9MFB7_9BACT|nr:hypothetical protein Mal15_32910 [Stieleria maiorica]
MRVIRSVESSSLFGLGSAAAAERYDRVTALRSVGNSWGQRFYTWPDNGSTLCRVRRRVLIASRPATMRAPG